jgi:hypothetical protein
MTPEPFGKDDPNFWEPGIYRDHAGRYGGARGGLVVVQHRSTGLAPLAL